MNLKAAAKKIFLGAVAALSVFGIAGCSKTPEKAGPAIAYVPDNSLVVLYGDASAINKLPILDSFLKKVAEQNKMANISFNAKEKYHCTTAVFCNDEKILAKKLDDSNLSLNFHVIMCYETDTEAEAHFAEIRDLEKELKAKLKAILVDKLGTTTTMKIDVQDTKYNGKDTILFHFEVSDKQETVKIACRVIRYTPVITTVGVYINESIPEKCGFDKTAGKMQNTRYSDIPMKDVFFGIAGSPANIVQLQDKNGAKEKLNSMLQEAGEVQFQDIQLVRAEFVTPGENMLNLVISMNFTDAEKSEFVYQNVNPLITELSQNPMVAMFIMNPQLKKDNEKLVQQCAMNLQGIIALASAQLQEKMKTLKDEADKGGETADASASLE